MCGHVLLVFVDSRLAWVTGVPHLRTPIIESRLPVLHVLVVRLAVQLGVILIPIRSHRSVAL